MRDVPARWRRTPWRLGALGALSLAPYFTAHWLGDLRAQTWGFEAAYVAAFALYAVACAVVVREPPAAHRSSPALTPRSPHPPGTRLRVGAPVEAHEPAPQPASAGFAISARGFTPGRPAGARLPEHVRDAHQPPVREGCALEADREPFRSVAEQSGEANGARATLAVILVFAVLFRLVLMLTPPRLSDDMYRYVWDGRVQASGLSPYAHPPGAPEVAALRDGAIWPLINRKVAITVYPAGGELLYAALWRLAPDSVAAFQFAMALGSLLGGVLLMALLRSLGQPADRALILLWSPLAVFETAHSAHVDGLVLPLLVGAWLARVHGRHGLTCLWLGAATSLKLFPALLLPALWRTRDAEGRFRPDVRLPIGFAAAFALPYLPYLLTGTGVLGFLPRYFGERFNSGLAHAFALVGEAFGAPPESTANVGLLLALAAIGVACVVGLPPGDADAVRRCIWPIGAHALLTPNLHPWYLLWLLPPVALELRPGRYLFRLDAWAAWWLFTGLVALSYTFYVDWRPVPWAVALEFAPVYLLLGAAALRSLRGRGLTLPGHRRAVEHPAALD